MIEGTKGICKRGSNFTRERPKILEGKQHKKTGI